MPVTVDYLPIANGGGANVESQAQYVLDLAGGGSLENGYVTGLAKSAQMNKTWRQSSMVAAAVANFIANALQVDVLDDGNLSALTAKLTSAIQALERIKLTANTTFYVATTGNDSTGTGLTIGSPWLTVQHAINVLLANYDLGGFTATIQVADGTYTGGVVVSTQFTGGGSVVLQGNIGTPGNCIISTTSADCIQTTGGGVTLSVIGFKFATTTTGNCLRALYGSQINVTGAVQFGACAGIHCYALDGGRISITANYTINGGAQYHWVSEACSTLVAANLTITTSGTPAFSSAFALARSAANVQVQSNTFSGTGATGPRYSVDTAGVIQTNGAGATYLPGNAGGVATTPGIYN